MAHALAGVLRSALCGVRRVVGVSVAASTTLLAHAGVFGLRLHASAVLPTTLTSLKKKDNTRTLFSRNTKP